MKLFSNYFRAKLAIFVILMTIGTSGLLGQSYWTSVTGGGLPAGNRNSTMVADNSIYIKISNGSFTIYRSLDYGSSWNPITIPGIFSPNFEYMVSSGDSILIGGYYGAYYSADNGASWTQRNVGMASGTGQDIYLNALEKIDNYVIASTQNGRYYVSTNFGESWTDISNGQLSNNMYGITKYNNRFIAGSDLGSSKYTDDNGATWQPITSLNGIQVHRMKLFRGTIFISTFNNFGIWASTDGGNTWVAKNNGMPYIFGNLTTTVGIMAINENIFIGTWNGCYFSSNMGESWVAANQGYTNTGMSEMRGNSKVLLARGDWADPTFIHVMPRLTTTPITNITGTAATSGATIVANGATILSKGLCWNTAGQPRLSDSHSSDGTGDATFTGSISGLQGNTVYHVRSYATTSYDPVYGTELVFTTIPTLGEWGLIAFGSLIAIIGGFVVWRRFV